MNAHLRGCRHRPRQRAANRRGLMVIIALVCLLVITSIVGSMIKNAIFTRRELLVERDLRQTELLVQAGADRAATRLATTPDFKGDAWDLPAAAIANNGTGRVTTEITRNPANQTIDLRVVAEYPLDRDFPIRRTQTFHIAVSAIK